MKNAITKAFIDAPRSNFVRDEYSASALYDTALPIGFGQTISQPTTVRLMLEWLEVEPGNKILDVGSGSGWTTALLASLTGPKGSVYAVERIPELVEFGRENCSRLGIKNVRFFRAGNRLGLPEYGSYDRILVGASADMFPSELLGQLNVGGKMVLPVRNDILEIGKTNGRGWQTKRHPGFVFVPLEYKKEAKNGKLQHHPI